MSSTLEGTWQLLAHKYGDAQAFTETEAEPKIHLKYMTATHFIWVYYDRQTHQLEAAAGGYTRCMATSTAK